MLVILALHLQFVAAVNDLLHMGVETL